MDQFKLPDSVQTGKEEIDQNWQATFDAMQDAIAIMDTSHRIVKVNKIMAGLLGMSPQDIEGRFCYQLVHGLDAPPAFCPHSRLLQDSRRHRAEVFEKRLGGWFDVSASPLMDSSGRVTGCVHVAHDIIRNKAAHEHLVRQEKLLQSVNRILQETLTCDSDYEVARTCLNMAEEITGSRFGWIGEINSKGLLDTIALTDPGWEFCNITQTDAPKSICNMQLRGIWSRILIEEQSQIFNDPANHPFRVGLPAGHPPLTCFLGVPLKRGFKIIGMIGLGNKTGGYTGQDQNAIESLSAVFVEALFRKRAEIEKDRMAGDLIKARKMETIGVLAGGLSHDLNNILTGLLGFLQMAQIRIDPESPAGHDLTRALTAGDQARELSHRFLAISGFMGLSITAVPIDKLLTPILSSVPPQVSVDVQISNDLQTLAVDKIRFQEALAQVFKNAVEAMPQGGTVIISAEKVHMDFSGNKMASIPAQDHYVRISITDNGRGIAEESLPRIFDPYFSTKQKGIQRGMGLGLTAAYSIVSQHGGHLHVRSTVNVGTTVEILIPIR
jgi:PAS domain S-box-containing protein